MTDINASTYLVPTPIGNLEDITLRALNVLRKVDVIACEDTRHTLKLLNHYEIKKIKVYHSHNEKNSAQGIIQLLQAKQSVALVSDGGSPCISDPGWVVVEAAIKNQLPIEALPGPTALIPVLSLSGFVLIVFVLVVSLLQIWPTTE